LFAASVVAIVTFVVPMTASAQTNPPVRDDWAFTSFRVGPPVQLSTPIHDDWAVASSRPVYASPPIHDDWAVASSRPVYASPPIHDDWAVASSNVALNLQLSPQGE
jgi:hypothetical protein